MEDVLAVIHEWTEPCELNLGTDGAFTQTLCIETIEPKAARKPIVAIIEESRQQWPFDHMRLETSERAYLRGRAATLDVADLHRRA